MGGGGGEWIRQFLMKIHLLHHPRNVFRSDICKHYKVKASRLLININFYLSMTHTHIGNMNISNCNDLALMKLTFQATYDI